MLDEIYLRLLLELMPKPFRMSDFENQRLLSNMKCDSNNHNLYGELIKKIYLKDSESEFGLVFGDGLHPATLCDLSRALMTAPDIRTIFSVLERNHHILGSSYYLCVHETNNTVSLSISFPYKQTTSSVQRRFCAEAAFSYLLNCLNEVSKQTIRPIALSFDYQEPSYAESYTRRFGCPSQFDAPLCMITFEKSILDAPNNTKDMTLHSLYLKKAFDNWKASQELLGFEYHAITHVMANPQEATNSQFLSDRLNISVRGLQAKLNKRDHSFSSIVNQARRELAKICLFQKSQCIDTTAESLGFSSTSGFRRYFKTEFGMTPTEFMEEFSISPNEAKGNSIILTYSASLALIPLHSEINMNGKPSGGFVQLVQALDQALGDGHEIRIEQQPFKNSIKNVKRGLADFHLPLIRPHHTNTSALGFDYVSEKISDVAFVLYTRSNQAPLDLDSLKPYRIETIHGHGQLIELTNAEVETIEEGITRVLTNDSDGFIMEQEAVDQFLIRNEIKGIRRSLFKNYEACIVINKEKNNSDIDFVLSKAIRSLKSSGQLQSICKTIHQPYIDWQPNEIENVRKMG